MTPFVPSGRRDLQAGRQGYYHEPQLDLYFLRARFYDPATGQFVSEDPKGPDADENLYRYVGNNPVNETDPSGAEAPPSPEFLKDPPRDSTGHTAIGRAKDGSWQYPPPPPPVWTRGGDEVGARGTAYYRKNGVWFRAPYEVKPGWDLRNQQHNWESIDSTKEEQLRTLPFDISLYERQRSSPSLSPGDLERDETALPEPPSTPVPPPPLPRSLPVPEGPAEGDPGSGDHSVRDFLRGFGWGLLKVGGVIGAFLAVATVLTLASLFFLGAAWPAVLTVGLFAAGLGTVMAYMFGKRRAELGQDWWQVYLGGLADVLGFSQFYSGITGKDPLTCEPVPGTWEERGERTGEGLMMMLGWALIFFGFRGRKPPVEGEPAPGGAPRPPRNSLLEQFKDWWRKRSRRRDKTTEEAPPETRETKPSGEEPAQPTHEAEAGPTKRGREPATAGARGRRLSPREFEEAWRRRVDGEPEEPFPFRDVPEGRPVTTGGKNPNGVDVDVPTKTHLWQVKRHEPTTTGVNMRNRKQIARTVEAARRAGRRAGVVLPDDVNPQLLQEYRTLSESLGFDIQFQSAFAQ